MKEPIYEYDFPDAFINEQVQYPKKKPFNVYMDRYMDPQDVNKRYLEDKLSKTHPFEGPERRLRFPNAHYFGKEPSWLKIELEKRRLGRGRIRDTE
jgi:large subunit ribosomal protein L38